MDCVELMNFKRSTEMKNYIRDLKSFIQKVETNSVSEADKRFYWYSSYISCIKIRHEGRRKIALNYLVNNMKHDIRACEIRLSNFEKHGNFAWDPRDVGHREVQKAIQEDYRALEGSLGNIIKNGIYS